MAQEKHLKVKSVCFLADLPQASSVEKSSRNLITFSREYNLVFVAGGSDVYYFPADVVNGDRACDKIRMKELDSKHLPLSSPVKRIDCNCTGSLLAVCTEETGSPLAHIYFISKMLSGWKEPDFRFPLSSQPASHLICFKWNPVESGCCLFMDSNGVAKVVTVQMHGTMNVVGVGSSSEGITCVAWSPKGKQFVAGKRDGSFAQYKVSCQLYRKFNRPLDQRLVAVVDIVWLCPREFLLAYSTSSYPKRQVLTLAWNTKEKPTAIEYSSFYDYAFIPNDSEALGRCFLPPLQNRHIQLSSPTVDGEIYAFSRSSGIGSSNVWTPCKVSMDSSASKLISEIIVGCVAAGDDSRLLIYTRGGQLASVSIDLRAENAFLPLLNGALSTMAAKKADKLAGASLNPADADRVFEMVESFVADLESLKANVQSRLINRQWQSERVVDLAEVHQLFEEASGEFKKIVRDVGTQKTKTESSSEVVWKFADLKTAMDRMEILKVLRSMPLDEDFRQKEESIRFDLARIMDTVDRIKKLKTERVYRGDLISTPTCTPVRQKRERQSILKSKCVLDRILALTQNLYDKVSALAISNGIQMLDIATNVESKCDDSSVEEDFNFLLENLRISNVGRGANLEDSLETKSSIIRHHLPVCKQQRVIVPPAIKFSPTVQPRSAISTLSKPVEKASNVNRTPDASFVGLPGGVQKVALSDAERNALDRLGFPKVTKSEESVKAPPKVVSKPLTAKPVAEKMAPVLPNGETKWTSNISIKGAQQQKVATPTTGKSAEVRSTPLGRDSAPSTFSFKPLQQQKDTSLPSAAVASKPHSVGVPATTVGRLPSVSPVLPSAASAGGTKLSDFSFKASDQQIVGTPLTTVPLARLPTTTVAEAKPQPTVTKAVVDLDSEKKSTQISTESKTSTVTATVAPTVSMVSSATAVSEDAKPAFTSNTSKLFSGLFPTSKVVTPPTESKAAVGSSAETKDQSVTSFSFAPTGKVEEQNDEMETADSKSAASVLPNFSFTTAEDVGAVGIGSFGGLGGQPSAEAASKNIFGGGVVASVPQKAVFGGASPFGATSSFGSSSSFRGASPFGSSSQFSASNPSSTFGSPFSGVAAQPTAGPFSSGTVAQSGFVGSSPPGQPLSSGFGAAPTFGGSAFGQSSTFKTASPFSDRSAFGSNAPPPTGGFSAFAASSVPTFGSLAGSNKPPTAGFGSQPNAQPQQAQQQSTFTQWRG